MHDGVLMPAWCVILTKMASFKPSKPSERCMHGAVGGVILGRVHVWVTPV